MQTIEIWPDEIEGGDAVLDDKAFTYLRMVDNDSGKTVIALLNPEAEQRMIATLAQWARMRSGNGQPN